MINSVVLSRNAMKDLRSVPKHVSVKLLSWMIDVQRDGLETVKKRPGFHDEPLKGKRQGQHSIRLSRAYRAIYSIQGREIEFVEVEEVNKHDY